MKPAADGETLFISDLHLALERPAVTALFLDFLAHRARGAQALYILGDLFEFWIGDDMADEPPLRPIVAGLSALTATGVPVYIMHGNRDFLIGEHFERRTGCRLISDPIRIDLYGTPVLLMHGDTLCTDDVEYQAFRKIVRDRAWQRDILAKSLPERIALGRNYREQSRLSTAGKIQEIMDVTPHTVDAALREHGVRHMIHGHTHRPARHAFQLDGAPAVRQVLADWHDEHGSVLACRARGWDVETLRFHHLHRQPPTLPSPARGGG